MDYKEKYEMALEGIQEILSSGEDSIKMSRLQLRLQGIFPELKESEDEKIRKTLIRFHKSTIDVDGIKGEDIIAWLENLNLIKAKSPQLGEQKPAEWSEEDENIKQWIISDIEKLFSLNKKSSIISDKEIIWLKSLKDKYTWKPSEEQMEAVKRASNGSRAIAGKDYLIMESLYNDLEKLTE